MPIVNNSVKRFIINADDFGYSADTVQRTIECFEAGALTSATLMTNMPEYTQAAHYALKHPEFSFGLHLCLTDEAPLSRPDKIPSLISPDGRLWPTGIFWRRALTGRIAASEVTVEAEAQINRMIASGISISHVDGHGHVHKIPQVIFALKGLMRKYGIRSIRRTQNLRYSGRIGLGSVYDTISNMFLRRLGRTTDFFLMPCGDIGANDGDWLLHLGNRLPAGTTEIGIHPGTEEDWRRWEAEPVLKGMGEFLARSGAQLINFNMLEGC